MDGKRERFQLRLSYVVDLARRDGHLFIPDYSKSGFEGAGLERVSHEAEIAAT